MSRNDCGQVVHTVTKQHNVVLAKDGSALELERNRG